MYTENGLLVDLGEIHDIIKKSDVFAAAFRLFPERLLIDTRFDASDPQGPSGMPMVAIVDPVETVQERFFWLGQHRPALGMPKDFQFFFWPHSVRYLDESGVWAALRERVSACGFGGAERTCDDALRDLIERERLANMQAVRGEKYHTVWAASPQIPD
jgi:hypothetical protein